MFVIRSDRRLQFASCTSKQSSGSKNLAVLHKLGDRLNKILGMNLNEKDLDGKPNKPLDLLFNPSNLNLLKSAVTWLTEQALSVGK